MDLNKVGQSKVFKGILIGIGALVIALLIFKAGMIIGYRKTNFFFRGGPNNHRNFGEPEPRGGFFSNFRDRNPMIGHGSSGQILKIDGSTIDMMERDNVEKMVVVNDQTVMRSDDATIKLADLKVNDYIVVIGQPNNAGQIEAKFVRVMPPPSGAPIQAVPSNTNQPTSNQQ